MKNLERIRVRKGMTQTELAEITGISRQTINGLENNPDKSCSSATMLKIAQALEVTIDELFFA